VKIETYRSYEDLHEAISEEMIGQVRDNQKLIILKKFLDSKRCDSIVDYMKNIGRSSLPNYELIQEGAKNFHRINMDDERAYVQGTFHQFSFFPWNQDVFNFFELFEKIYFLKNKFGKLNERSFLAKTAENGCVARVSVQFYPAGSGFLNKHSDPVDYHQLVVPILQLSSKGKDFREGGSYVMNNQDEKIVLDDVAEKGDVLFFNATSPHGVDTIDPNSESTWLDFQGRWAILFAVNKVAGNQNISNSITHKS
jgi:hypothetical protein